MVLFPSQDESGFEPGAGFVAWVPRAEIVIVMAELIVGQRFFWMRYTKAFCHENPFGTTPTISA